jgi:hypothetical protein
MSEIVIGRGESVRLVIGIRAARPMGVAISNRGLIAPLGKNFAETRNIISFRLYI